MLAYVYIIEFIVSQQKQLILIPINFTKECLASARKPHANAKFIFFRRKLMDCLRRLIVVVVNFFFCKKIYAADSRVEREIDFRKKEK